MIFTSLNYDGTATATAQGFDLSVRIERDDTSDAPWDSEDGHGPVSQRRRYQDGNGHVIKEPGELHLGGGWFGDGHAPGCNVGGFDDQNKAISALYAAHRATMSPRAYAALAARADFERLRAWCNDDWYYCGVIVTASRNGVELGNASLWGIESDWSEGLLDEANNCADEAIRYAQTALAALTE